MSENITNGVVEKIRKDRKGVCCGGEWYSVRNASIFADVSKGDLLTADYDRNGQWINCVEATVKVTKSATAGKFGGSSGSGGSNGDQFRTRSEIIRTTALDASIAFLKDQYDGNYADDVEQTLKTAQLFVAYVEGKIAVDMGKAAATPANDEQAQAEAAAAATAAAEAAAAQAAADAAAAAAKAAAEAPSALSSFLGE